MEIFLEDIRENTNDGFGNTSFQFAVVISMEFPARVNDVLVSGVKTTFMQGLCRG